MKILILGADGMIGHKMAQTFSNSNFEIHLNTRTNKEFLEKIVPENHIHQFEFLNQDIPELLNKVFPDIILNAAGITIRRGSEILENAIKLNSELPKKIDSWCEFNKKRQIHFSTDCVFSGLKGKGASHPLQTLSSTSSSFFIFLNMKLQTEFYIYSGHFY